MKEVNQMTNKINLIQPHQLLQQNQIQKKQVKSDLAFKDVFKKASEQLVLSKHAQERLDERKIHINDRQWEKITNKVQEAKEKGIQDSLVVLNNATLLVSAKNNTVITALDREESGSRIFTNINGTILINE